MDNQEICVKKREKFASTLRQINNLREERGELLRLSAPNINSMAAASIEHLYFERFPKRYKSDHLKIIREMKEEYDCVRDGVLGGLRFRVAEIAHDMKRLEDSLSKIGARPCPGDLKLMYHWVYPHTSQGLGQRQYDKTEAETYCRRAEHNGIKAVVRERENTGRFPDFFVDVFVKDQLDVEILKRCSGPPLREVVKNYWMSGVNPRVYLPFLPHGYEESVGLDFFGGEKR